MQSGTRNLSRFWKTKTKEILERSRLSLAKKLLAYKIFLRPLLIYKWFEGRNNEIKHLEVQALKRIFVTHSEQGLYERYTDVDVTKYMRIQEIRWKHATGSDFSNLRSMLHALSKTADDPSPYFTRAGHHHHTRSMSTSTDTVSSTMTVLRRSTRLANKKRTQHSRR